MRRRLPDEFGLYDMSGDFRDRVQHRWHPSYSWYGKPHYFRNNSLRLRFAQTCPTSQHSLTTNPIF